MSLMSHSAVEDTIKELATRNFTALSALACRNRLRARLAFLLTKTVNQPCATILSTSNNTTDMINGSVSISTRAFFGYFSQSDHLVTFALRKKVTHTAEHIR